MLPKIDLYEPLLLQSYVVLFFITLILCVVIILSTGYGFSRRPTLDENAIQSAHTGFVPRVGGIALFISISALIPLLTFGFVPLSIIFNLDTKEIILPKLLKLIEVIRHSRMLRISTVIIP